MDANKRSVDNHAVQCYGCSVCVLSCPKHAISMKMDKRGFYYPYVDENCVNCGLCVSSCPIGREKEFKNDRANNCFAIKNNDDTRYTSSSGGIYTAITNIVIEELEGYCVGVSYDDNLQPTYTIAKTKEERDRHRESKYIQPILSITTLSEIENIIKQGKHIAITGSPCLITGIKSLFKIKRINDEKVLYIDIVCHGVPSPKMWRDYLNEIEAKHSSKIIEYTFRDKTKGWRGYHVKVKLDNGLIIEDNDEVNTFVNFFKENLNLRDSCHNCPYASLNRSGDITIGDFWGIEAIDPEFSDNLGISMVFANTEKGSELINRILKDVLYKTYSSRVVIQPNLHRATEYGVENKKFWSIYEKKGYKAIRERFAKGGKKYILHHLRMSIGIHLNRIRTAIGK